MGPRANRLCLAWVSLERGSKKSGQATREREAGELLGEAGGNTARLIGSTTSIDTHATARATELFLVENKVGIRNIISEPTGISHAKLELAVAGIELVVMNRDTVIESDWPDREIQA